MLCMLRSIIASCLAGAVMSVMAQEQEQTMLFDLHATCLGSTGHSAVLEVSWVPVQSLPPPPSAPPAAPPFSFSFPFHPHFPHFQPGQVQAQSQAQASSSGSTYDGLEPLSSSYYTYYSSAEEEKLLGHLMLVGEFTQFHQQYSRNVHLADPMVHIDVPSWALQHKTFSSLLLKQGGQVVARLEFVELGAMCGHNEHHEGEVDGGAHLPYIAIM